MMSDILRGLHTSHSLSPLTNHVILSVYGPGRICSEAGMQRDTENAVQSITDPLPV